jgi:molybdate transport system substrate-binding protein
VKRHLLPAGAFVLLALAAACGGAPGGGPAGSKTVRVAAAADLRYALDALVERFHAAHPDLTIAPTYGSSGVFFAQLQQGAPFDLYLSADVSYPRQLESKGIVASGGTFTYAIGRLVLWVLSDSTLDLPAQGMRALLDPSVAHVAIANPEHAPYGRAAQAALQSAGMLDEVRPKLVFGENVSQTLQFVQSGSADVGIVALSLALAPTVANEGRYWDVPLDLYPRMEQGGGILKSARDPQAAGTFVAFMQGDEGRAVLERFGFSMAGR